MSVWHHLVDPDQQGATPERNQVGMGIIRELEPGKSRDSLIKRLIEENVPLVFYKADTFINLHPDSAFLADDLVSEGILALTQAVNDLAEMETPEDGGNPTGFISRRIGWALSGCVKSHERHKMIPGAIDGEEGYKPPSKPVVVDPKEMIELKDLLDASCQTDEDRVILQLRYQGSTDDEIAKRLSITRRAVSKRRQFILTRFEHLIEKTR